MREKRKITNGRLKIEKSGYMKRRGCVDKTFTLRMNKGKTFDKQKTVYPTAMSFRKPYERVENN